VQRVIAYVDGFNLYYGLRDRGWKGFYWLNVQALAQHLLKPRQALVQTKYFTTIVEYPPDRSQRQSTQVHGLHVETNNPATPAWWRSWPSWNRIGRPWSTASSTPSPFLSQA